MPLMLLLLSKQQKASGIMTRVFVFLCVTLRDLFLFLFASVRHLVLLSFFPFSFEKSFLGKGAKEKRNNGFFNA